MKNKNIKKTSKRKRLYGTVVSNKMDKTVVVEVSSLKEYPKYKKRVRESKKYKVHDPDNKYKIGDKVVIEESRPLSKDKRWMIIK